MIPKVRTTPEYRKGVDKINDILAAKAIKVAPPRIAVGLGDNEKISISLYEYKIHKGRGYRIYYTKNANVITLLCIGNKSSQDADISLAKKILLSL